jgi:hypothetical protein
LGWAADGAITPVAVLPKGRDLIPEFQPNSEQRRK